jgi:hypothetical protein
MQVQEVKEEGEGGGSDDSSEYSNDFEDTPTKAERYSDNIGQNDKKNRSGNKENYDRNNYRPKDNIYDGYVRVESRPGEFREKETSARGYSDTYNYKEKVRI